MKRCGTCKWWEYQGTDDHDPDHIGCMSQSSRDYGSCCWDVTHAENMKLPASVWWKYPMYSFDGETCEAYEVKDEN